MCVCVPCMLSFAFTLRLYDNAEYAFLRRLPTRVLFRVECVRQDTLREVVRTLWRLAALICHHFHAHPLQISLCWPRLVAGTRPAALYSVLDSQWSARSPAPPHGLSLASLADIAPLARLVEGIRASGSEQVLYAHGPPHSIRDALVVLSLIHI